MMMAGGFPHRTGRPQVAVDSDHRTDCWYRLAGYGRSTDQMSTAGSGHQTDRSVAAAGSDRPSWDSVTIAPFDWQTAHLVVAAGLVELTDCPVVTADSDCLIEWSVAVADSDRPIGHLTVAVGSDPPTSCPAVTAHHDRSTVELASRRAVAVEMGSTDRAETAVNPSIALADDPAVATAGRAGRAGHHSVGTLSPRRHR